MSDPPQPSRCTARLKSSWYSSASAPPASAARWRISATSARNLSPNASWLTEATFADLVALCQFMPGPASSQTGMAIGLLRAGPLGMLAAWVGFTLPSAVAMTLFAYGVGAIGDVSHAGWLRGLKLVAVAVVAQAVWGMARVLAPDRAGPASPSRPAWCALAVPSSLGQIAAILLGAVIGMTVLPNGGGRSRHAGEHGGADPDRLSAWLLVTFFALLFGLPLLADARVAIRSRWWRRSTRLAPWCSAAAMSCCRCCRPRWCRRAGWTRTCSWRGMARHRRCRDRSSPSRRFWARWRAPGPNGWIGALVATVAIFASSFLLVGGLLPFWDSLRHRVPACARRCAG